MGPTITTTSRRILRLGDLAQTPIRAIQVRELHLQYQLRRLPRIGGLWSSARTLHLLEPSRRDTGFGSTGSTGFGATNNNTSGGLFGGGSTGGFGSSGGTSTALLCSGSFSWAWSFMWLLPYLHVNTLSYSKISPLSAPCHSSQASRCVDHGLSI